MAYRKINWKKIEKELVSKLTSGTPLTTACNEIGIEPTTVYRRMQTNTKFAIAIRRAEVVFASKIRSRNIHLLAKMEEALGLITKTKRGKEVDPMQDFVKLIHNKKIDKQLLKIYVDHLHWLSERRVRDEYATKQILEGGFKIETNEKQEIVSLLEGIYKKFYKNNKTKEKSNNKKHEQAK